MAKRVSSQVLISRYAGYIGLEVCVHLRGGDVYNPGDEEVRGTFNAIAERIRGGADWNGKQYDAVISSGFRVRTFALSRITAVHLNSDRCPATASSSPSWWSPP